jgi:hypothetical protein
MTCRRLSGRSLDVVQDDRQALGKQREVPVCRENGEVVPHSYGADQKVGVRALDASGTTQIEEFGGGHVVLGQQGQIRKGGEVCIQSVKLGLIPHSGEYFLPDWAYDLDQMGSDQASQLQHFRILNILGSA